MRIQSKLGFLLIVITLLLAGGFYYKVQENRQYSDTTVVYETPNKLNPFELYDHNGQLVNNKSISGKWSLVFLGYLSCPDICPMTMAKLSYVLPELNNVSDIPVQVLFVSVDPKRDSAEKRKQYVEYFNPNILGVSAEQEALFPFVRNLGLMYSIPDTDAVDYFVDHSASVVLIDPNGNMVAKFKPEINDNQVPTINPTTMIFDFSTLIK